VVFGEAEGQIDRQIDGKIGRQTIVHTCVISCRERSDPRYRLARYKYIYVPCRKTSPVLTWPRLFHIFISKILGFYLEEKAT
jgi:hypothetical protein